MIKNCKRCCAQFDGDSRTKYCSPTCSEMSRIESQRAYHKVTGGAMVKIMPARQRSDGSAEWKRDKEYDDGYGKQLETVYSPRAIIAINRSVAECKSCHMNKPLINGYCSECITLGANERQVMRPAEIQARSNAGRANSANSPWRYGIGGK